MQSSASINLIKKSESLLDQIIKWSLSIGRLLIIITELVAFTTFLLRFSLDRQLIDLHSKIKGQQAIVDSVSDGEKTYRNLQQRLSSASEISKEGSKKLQILEDIIEKTPSGSSFDSLSIDNEKIIIQGNFSTITNLNTIIKFLKEYPAVSLVTISSISNQPGTSNIKAVINVILKQ